MSLKTHRNSQQTRDAVRNAGLKLGNCHRRCANIMPTLSQHLVFAGQITCIACYYGRRTGDCKHKSFVWHLYNVGPTSLTLVRHCTNVIQMFCAYWGLNVAFCCLSRDMTKSVMVTHWETPTRSSRRLMTGLFEEVALLFSNYEIAAPLTWLQRVPRHCGTIPVSTTVITRQLYFWTLGSLWSGND